MMEKDLLDKCMEDDDVTQKRGPPVLQLLILEIFYLKLVFGSVKLRKYNVFNKSNPALVKTEILDKQ